MSRNAFFWGSGVFSIAQATILGDLAGIIAFGSVGFLGIAGSFTLDAKKARSHGKAWISFALATSNIPFLAIIQGRQKLVLREIGPWRIALGMCMFLITLIFDRTLCGHNLFLGGTM